MKKWGAHRIYLQGLASDYIGRSLGVRCIYENLHRMCEGVGVSIRIECHGEKARAEVVPRGTLRISLYIISNFCNLHIQAPFLRSFYARSQLNVYYDFHLDR